MLTFVRSVVPFIPCGHHNLTLVWMKTTRLTEKQVAFEFPCGLQYIVGRIVAVVLEICLFRSVTSGAWTEEKIQHVGTPFKYLLSCLLNFWQTHAGKSQREQSDKLIECGSGEYMLVWLPVRSGSCVHRWAEQVKEVGRISGAGPAESWLAELWPKSILDGWTVTQSLGIYQTSAWLWLSWCVVELRLPTANYAFYIRGLTASKVEKVSAPEGVPFLLLQLQT